jgi:hypothetical protein
MNCVNQVTSVSVFWLFRGYSVLGICGVRTRIHGFNTENTEGTKKTREAEKSRPLSRPVIFWMRRPELSGSFRVEYHWDGAYEIEYEFTR